MRAGFSREPSLVYLLSFAGQVDLSITISIDADLSITISIDADFHSTLAYSLGWLVSTYSP
jgi:hypothetical protein